MSRKNVVTVRTATSDDVDKILQVSEGIYEGRDYLPVVLHQWLNLETKLIFLAEYEGEVIGLQVADIAENQRSFVTQALRIHPKYRGKKLSYQIVDAVIESVQSKFPRMLKNRCVSEKYGAAFMMFRNKGFAPVMEQRMQSIHNIPTEAVRQKVAESNECSMARLGATDAIELYKSNRLLHLIGQHSFILVDNVFPHKLPEDAISVANKVEQVFIDVSLREFHQGIFPKSFSQGVLSKRVAVEVWICQIYTDDVDLFKKHFLCQLRAAAQRVQKHDFIFRFFQSSGSKFDGLEVISDEISRLELNGDVKRDVRVLLEYDLAYQIHNNHV